MTWRELADLLGVEAQKAGLGLGVGLSTVLKATGPEILLLHSKSKAVVDAAIVDFVKARIWPKLDLPNRAMLTRRLLFAENLARFLAHSRTKDDAHVLAAPLGDEPALVEWILIDAWEHYELLRLQMFS